MDEYTPPSAISVTDIDTTEWPASLLCLRLFVAVCRGLSTLRSQTTISTRREIKSAILLDLCVSSLRRGHANLLCIVPILSYETAFTPLGRAGRTVEGTHTGSGGKNGFDHINRNAPVLIRTPKLTRFEPAQYWGGGPPGNSVVLNPFFFVAVFAFCGPKTLANPSFDLGTFRL